MFQNITYGKVSEIIEMAGESRTRGPADGPPAQRKPITHEPPLRPQPAADWQAALRRYLEDLPDKAIEELEAIYLFGRGDFDTFDKAAAAAAGRALAKPARIAFVTAQPDLVSALRAAQNEAPEE